MEKQLYKYDLRKEEEKLISTLDNKDIPKGIDGKLMFAATVMFSTTGNPDFMD